MLNLTSTSHLIRLVTAASANLEAHASWGDANGASLSLGGQVAHNITTATTTTLVAAPASGVVRNVKGLHIANVSAVVSSRITVELFDGTNAVELMSCVLLPGEKLILSEGGSWKHHDALGAEYPTVGLGAYNGYSVPFMKTGTASDAIGYWYCTSKDAGFPGAWSPGTPGVNGRVTDGTQSADAGCIPILNPASGANFLTDLQLASSVNHSNMFFDVLWVNSGLSVTTTTAQTIATPTLPARDANGGTNGVGCMIALLTTSANNNAAVVSNSVVSYTNSDGVSGRTAVLVGVVGSQIPATPVVGTIVWFSLQAGDQGVRSIESITLNTSLTAGSVSLMICRPIAVIGTTLPNVCARKEIGSPGIRLRNGVCLLHCVLSSATTSTFFVGELTVMEK